MRQGAVAGMIRRHGSIVAWEHATPADGDLVNRDARAPNLTVFGPRVPSSPSGETFGRKYKVRVYVSKKISSLFTQSFGPLDVRDCQLDIAVPFAPEPQHGIVLPGKIELEDWNAGRFVVYPKNNPDEEGEIALLARDRFTFAGQRYIVKAAAIPLQDRNITCAYRLLVGLDPFSTPTLDIR